MAFRAMVVGTNREGDHGDGRPLHLFAIQCACVQRQLFRFGKFDAVGCVVEILP